MKFAIATHSFLLVIEFDQWWQPVNHWVIGTGYHYGIGLCYNPASQSPTHFTAYRGGMTLAEQIDRELITYQNNHNFTKITVQSLDHTFKDIHQISQAAHGTYIANTGRNSLVYLGSTGKRHEHFFSNVTYDYNHVNSVFPYGDKVLVMLHNKAHKESEVVILNHDRDCGFTQEKNSSLWEIGCHNLYIENGRLFYNSSRANRFVQAHLTQSRITKAITVDGHTKGMSVSNSHILIGMSEHTVRDLRARSKGFIVVIDKASLNIIATVDINFSDLPHPVGNINEIRNLSEYDMAHSSQNAKAMDWSQVKLAESERWQHTAFQLKTTALKPLRRLKQKLLGYTK